MWLLDGWPLDNEKHLRDLLEIPATREIVAITPLDYSAVIPQPRPRQDPDLTRKVKWVD